MDVSWLRSNARVTVHTSSHFPHTHTSAGNAVDVNWLRNTLNANNTVNLLGIGVTTIGLQASVGKLRGFKRL